METTGLISGVSGETEERIRELFEQAALCAPCVLFMDEIDSISADRKNASKDMERRIVAQLLASLDNLPRKDGGDQVIVIGATNRADSLDPSLRRIGRFDQEVCLGMQKSHFYRLTFFKILKLIFVDIDFFSILTKCFSFFFCIIRYTRS